jgi:hypothetical protein
MKKPILSETAIAFARQVAESLFTGRKVRARLMTRTELQDSLAIAFQTGADMIERVRGVR